MDVDARPREVRPRHRLQRPGRAVQEAGGGRRSCPTCSTRSPVSLPASSTSATAATRSSSSTSSTPPRSTSRSATPPSSKGMEGMPDIVAEPHALRRAYQDELKDVPRLAEEGLPVDRHRLRAASGPTRTWTGPCQATWRRVRCGSADRPGGVGEPRAKPNRCLDAAMMVGFARGSPTLRRSPRPDIRDPAQESTLSISRSFWAISFGAISHMLQFGIAATSLPILIHLLNRRKYREMRWAAMRFLMAALRKNQRRVKVEQWLLLADPDPRRSSWSSSAMAKPLLESLGAIALPGQRTHRVLVLDGSLSMAYVAGRQDPVRAGQGPRRAARPRLAAGGTCVSIVLMADPPRVVVGDASPSANSVRGPQGDRRPHPAPRRDRPRGEPRTPIERVLEVSTASPARRSSS